ncbi:MAG: hypothetical protein R6V10_06580 [bacterium]
MEKKPVTLVVLFSALLLVCLGTKCREKKPGHYVNKDKGFEISFPEKWEIREKRLDIDVIGFSPPTGPDDGFRDNVYVYSKKVPENKSADEVLDANISSMINTLTDFQPGDRGHTEIGAKKAARLEYRFRQGRFKLAGTLYVLTEGDRAYFIYTVAEQKSESAFEKAFTKTVKSFRILK